jgi:lipoyl(octanoyl) transferase
VQFIDLGLVAFSEVWDRQTETVRRIASGSLAETVYLVEHPHVFTIGRRGSMQNLIQSQDYEGNPIDVVRINRGGDVTYHGPGQLVVYPHLDLRRRERDLGHYLRSLEECVIRVAAHYEVRAYRRESLTGVWTDHGKLTSIGVGVRRWITMHGLALNVSTDLRYFKLINPCGIPECPMTSLEELLGRRAKMSDVKTILKTALVDVLDTPD